MSNVVDAHPSPTAIAHIADPTDRESRGLPPLPSRWEGGFAALTLTGYLAPVLGQVVAVLAYQLLPLAAGSSPATPAVPVAALGIAAGVTIIVWALEFLLLAPMMASPTALPRFYRELMARYQHVRDRWEVLGSSAQPVERKEAETQLDWERRALIGEDSRAGLPWASADGYVSVLRSVHRVEEALILIEPCERVLSDAEYDQLSLTHSTLDTRDDLLTDIKAATDDLSAAAAQADQSRERQARDKLRVVRYAIDTFRDDARDGVIRARNQLLQLMFVVSALTFLLFGLAEVFGVPAVCLISVAALYLVGAMVGCFNRLRIGAQQTSAEEDFGLYQARLMATLLMSGLAAIGGVFLVAALPVLTPIAGVTPQVPALSKIFDLSSNTTSLLYAAVFGLVPETVTKLLTGTADKLQTDLLASRPANSKTS
jgi:hypothetical protein